MGQKSPDASGIPFGYESAHQLPESVTISFFSTSPIDEGLRTIFLKRQQDSEL